ncbi:MAG: hypothetical protein RL318_2836 [Fibrobacterota bacterium]|jgi:hypothetical protein
MFFLGLTFSVLMGSSDTANAVDSIAPADPVPQSVAPSTAPMPANATDTVPKPHFLRLEDRVIEGHANRAPTEVRTLGRNELSQGASLADVLSLVPGVEVRRMGGLGGFSQVQLRQCPSQQVRVTMDGIALRDDGSSRSDLGGIPVESLEKVEIIQGATTGGDGRPELRLTSRQGWNRLGGSVTMGSFGERQASLWAGDASGQWSLSGWGQTAENDWPFFWDHGTKWNKKDDGIIRLPNNDYSGYGASLGWRPTPGIQAMLRGDRSDKGITGLYTANPKARYARTNGQFTVDSRSDATWDIPWQAAVRMHTSRWRDSAGGLDYRSNREAEDFGWNASGSVGLVRQHGDWLDGQLRTGFSHERNAWETTTPKKVHLTPVASRQGFFLAGGWAGQDPSKSFGASLLGRIETLQDERDVGASPMDGVVATPDSTWSTWAGDQQVRTWLRAPDRSWQTWISASHSQRTPDFHEIYGDNGMTFANYGLKPEESWTAELGLRLAQGPVSLGLQPWTGLYKKPIRREMIGASLVSRFENDSGYTAHGVDGDAALCTRYGSAKLQGGWSRTSIRSDLEAYRGNELDHSPRWRWNTTLGTPTWQGFLLEGISNYSSSSWSNSLNAPKDRLPGHTIHGLRLSWRRGPFTLLVQGDNLTNEEFEEFTDAPLAGRAWRVRIEWNQPKETK